jgi:hypothetical protein
MGEATGVSTGVEVNEEMLDFTIYSSSNTPTDKAAVTFWKRGLVCFNEKAVIALGLEPIPGTKFKEIVLYFNEVGDKKRIGFRIRNNTGLDSKVVMSIPVFSRRQYKENVLFISIGAFRREHGIDLGRENGWFPLKYNTHVGIHYIEIPSVIYNKDQWV